MANSFPKPPPSFVGREEYVTRFKARLGHFRCFLYEGIAGAGKTALLLHLAQHAASAGLDGAVYLGVQPGEGISALVARLSGRLEGRGGVAPGPQADPYLRLVDLLASRKLVLLLDSLHNLRRDDLSALVRTCQRYKTEPYRIMGALRGDPDLSAMDRGTVHLERIGALTAADVAALGRAYGLDGDPLARLQADAARGGATGQPLTCHYLLALAGADLLPDEVLATQTARSVHAFKALMVHLAPRFPEPVQLALAGLARIGQPIDRSIAVAAFGAPLETALRQGLVEVLDHDVTVHELVLPLLPTSPTLSAAAANHIAAHLKERAERQGEPQAIIRAAETLAQAGLLEEAIETLAGGAEWASDPGFLEAYLKSLASLPATEALAPRLQLLGAEARMRHAHASVVMADMERLAAVADPWTRARALAALAQLHNGIGAPDKVIADFQALAPLKPAPAALLGTGVLAVEALLNADRHSEAEALIQTLLPSAASFASQEGQLRRHLGHIFAHSGRLAEALAEAQRAVACFEASGDLYHTATAYGFMGDLCRELGEFQDAKAAFTKFLEVATKWGDRSLIQIAELTDAWVSLDIGDVAHAAKRVAAVEKEVGAAPSRRLKRYLAAAQALLEAGRGHHERAAAMLGRVVEAWEAAGQRTITGTLKAQLIRSLIACDKLDAAEKVVRASLEGLDPATSSSRVAALLRESALIRLRRGDVQEAMKELAEACRLFGQGGNRREEALTLHRLGYAALDEGNLPLAKEKAAEALALATKIKHARAKALARELMSRTALLSDDFEAALAHAREAQQSLRRLGDELGVLHVSETLMRIYLHAGDLASALKLGPKLAEGAKAAGMRELRVRAVVLTGIALLRRDRKKAAARCFRPLPRKGFSPWTRLLMWRFGEALALAMGDTKAAV
ncbi:MAG TPA: tetratricopeptide repeat protein, partial [Myxococcota bacterium]|nr:tetratricopeptide repeat protein [Myxococcota bacterium]